MLDNLSSSELTGWKAYALLEPFGYEGIYHMLGIIASILVNTNLKKGAEKTKPGDFVPDFLKDPDEVKKMSPASIRDALKSIHMGTMKRLGKKKRKKR